MKLRNFLLLFVIVLFSLALPAFAVIGEMFTSDSDLSSSLINDILYDRNGIVWVATEDGLNRGDGSKFTVYRNDPQNANSIANNFVECIIQDDNGHILIGTYAGVQLYDPLHDNFSELAFQADGKTPYHGSVLQIVRLNSGEMITVGNDVNKISITPDKKVVLTPLPLPKSIVEPNAAIQDGDGNLWFSCDLNGVYRVDKKNKAKRYFGGDDTKIEVFAIGPDKRLYAGSTNKGLFVYDKKSDSFTHLLDDSPAARFRIKHIINADKGRMLISTDGQGLNHYNTATRQLEEMNMPIFDAKKLKVHKTIKDEYGNLWLALFQKGLFFIPKQSYGFQALRQNTPPNGTLIGSSCITSLLKDKAGTLWVGTDNDGLYELDSNMKSSRHHESRIPQIIMTMFEDSKANLWIGTYSEGAGILNRQTGEYRSIALQNSDGITGKNVFNFTEDNEGNIWIATMGAGLFRYTDGKVYYDKQINTRLNQWITSVLFFPITNMIYVGTYNGIYSINPKTKQKSSICENIIVNRLYGSGDKKDPKLWAATNTGLVKICRDSKKNRTYTTADGLPSNSIYSIESDGTNLWISTSHGLSRLNPKEETFSNFYVEDGLQSNEFYKGTSYRDRKTGTIFFGGTNGLTWFNPKAIGVSGSKVTVRLTNFYVKGQPVRGGMKSGGEEIISVPISEAREFNLCHADNSFSIEFATREFMNSSRIEYLYSFDDEGWKNIPQNQINPMMRGGNLLNFTDVDTGKHSLRIKAVCNGVESPELEVTVYVAPPWYASWWAKLLYLLAFIALAHKLFQREKKKEEQKRNELIQKHEAEIKESKLRFFTNISHEIRTPLSLVMSPLEKLLSSDPDEKRQSSYKTMYRNANRILKLVNELMDLRKIDNGRMRLKFSEIQLTDFIQDLYETFEQAAKQKEITFNFNHEGCDDLNVWVDPSNFDKIIVNLLSNAFKYTSKGGQIDIDISFGSNKNIAGPLAEYFEVSVTDTGIGIPVEARTRIFDRFYQVSETNASGTGIGLHLTSLLVQLHHGTIQVADNPAQKGTRFTVTIPRGKEHLNPEEIQESKQDCYTKSLKSESSIATASLYDDTSGSQKSVRAKKNKLVFVVEDDKEIQNYITQNIGEIYKIKTFNNGQEALTAMHDECPDLVITDVMMPEMDGLTFTRKIKQNVNLNHVPVIILTAKNREEEQLEGLEQGADAYMTKPFNIDILAQTAENLIALRQQLRNVYNGNQTQEKSVEKINVISNDEKLMEKIMQVVNKNLANPELTIEMLAKEVGISRVHLHRKLKELTNQSSSHFIRNLRMKQAAEILREKDLNISEVCYLVGFKHPNNFSVVFKEIYGMSPTAYAEKHRTAKDFNPNPIEKESE